MKSWKKMKVTEGKVGEAKRLGVELRANMKGKQVEMGNMSSDAAGKMPTKIVESNRIGAPWPLLHISIFNCLSINPLSIFSDA
jgi:hypothetical protein